MRANRLRALSVTGIVVSLLIASGSVWAHDHYYGDAPRYTHPYRPAVVVVPPRIVTYGYSASPVYYPPPVYVPAPIYYEPAPTYYAPPVYYGPSFGIEIYRGTHRYGRGHWRY